MHIFNQRYADSATGSGIDIAAPATSVTICCEEDPALGPILTSQDGNSAAAPMVSAMAAIVLSLHPEFTGAELKNFLIDPAHVWPAPEEVSAKRVALIKTVGSVILEYAPSSSDVDAIMDCFGGISDSIPDPSGHMINRLCGEVEFSVAGPGYYQEHSMDATDLSFAASGHNLGIIGDNFVVFSAETRAERLAKHGFISLQRGTRSAGTTGTSPAFRSGRGFRRPSWGPNPGRRRGCGRGGRR